MTKNAVLPLKHETDVSTETMQVFVQTLAADLHDIETFHPLTFSSTRLQAQQRCISQKLGHLDGIPFDILGLQGQVDWLLSRTHLTRRLRQTKSDTLKNAEMDQYLSSWVPPLVELCDWRQQVVRFKGQTAASRMSDAVLALNQLREKISGLDNQPTTSHDKVISDRAAQAVTELHDVLEEMVCFYRDYDPVMTWWLADPWASLSGKIRAFADLLRLRAGNDGNSSAGDIIGQPLGRKALMDEIEAECLPYTPEELIEIGESEFLWCESQMELASRALGFSDPKEALEHTRNTFVDPGEQIYVVRDLATEAVDYVLDRDMITVPEVAKDYWRTIMMTPKQQKINRFFTGGTEITVSYPTADMCHQDKMMSMRGNNPPFSRATVQHELIPGHHLQFYYMDRYNPHRKLFDTPFWIEGWALYWEFILWDRGFPGQISQSYATNEAENRIGMLFWRMHRCARIIFSIKFHLGQMEPQECVDLLVDRVGHERATAEGEVRRSLNGDYSPLYQAGYMLGALQLYALRKELLSSKGGWTEKDFHDRVMKEGIMPIELLRALLKKETLSSDWRSNWRFYNLSSQRQ